MQKPKPQKSVLATNHLSDVIDKTRLIRLREVMTKTGLSKTSVYRLTDAGKFPCALALSECSKAWRESEVNEWIASRQPVTAPMKPAPNRKAAA